MVYTLIRLLYVSKSQNEITKNKKTKKNIKLLLPQLRNKIPTTNFNITTKKKHTKHNRPKKSYIVYCV